MEKIQKHAMPCVKDRHPDRNKCNNQKSRKLEGNQATAAGAKKTLPPKAVSRS